MRAALAAAEARAEVETLRAATAEAELAQARALASATEAVIKSLRLEIARLRREQYGKSSDSASVSSGSPCAEISASRSVIDQNPN